MNSKQKGKRGELDLARSMRELGLDARRGQQYNGLEGRDVIGLPGAHVECKRVERLNIDQAMEQSVRDAAPGLVPVVCHRRSRREWMVTVRLRDIFNLADGLRGSHEN